MTDDRGQTIVGRMQKVDGGKPPVVIQNLLQMLHWGAPKRAPGEGHSIVGAAQSAWRMAQGAWRMAGRPLIKGVHYEK
jgi:hypothetical protein